MAGNCLDLFEVYGYKVKPSRITHSYQLESAMCFTGTMVLVLSIKPLHFVVILQGEKS